ncbi:hypothetical protein DBA29_27060 [Xenophilus aerolatus]|nr:hypothetical protein [Xenophilus aerolatus]
MPGLVLELQRDALDANVKVADLLRKALVVSRKLELAEMQDWIESELGSYENTDDCPLYRQMYGELKVWNPYHGFQPVLVPDQELADIICSGANTQSIGELEDLLRGDAKTFHMQMSGPQKAMLAKLIGVNLEPSLHIPRQSMVKILDSVRNRILQWSLDLEKRNILGSGLTFSKEEKAMASQINYHTVNNIGSMTNSQLQQHSSGVQVIEGALGTDLTKLVESIASSLSGLSLSQPDTQELLAELATLRSQLDSPKPKVGIIKESLASVRTVLEGAAGNLVASDLLARLGPLLGAIT